jgi:uncharacterized protein YndB with AHSA1/START domain
MTTVERRFRASSEQVYEALIDAERYPLWLVGAKVVHVPDSEWPAPGSSFDHRVGVGPLEVDDSTTVREVRPGRRLRLLVRARPFLEADVDFDVTSDGSGSVLRMDERPRGVFRFAAPFIGPLIKARNARSLALLAKVVDGPT